MTSKKNKPQGLFDPTIQEYLQDSPEPAYEPKKYTSKQLKKMEQDKARSQITLDMPEALICSLKNLAENHSTPASQIAGLLISIGLKHVEEGKIKVENYKEASRSMRYDWRIRIPSYPRILLNKPKNIPPSGAGGGSDLL